MAQKYLYARNYEQVGYDRQRELYVIALGGSVRLPGGESISFTQVTHDSLHVLVRPDNGFSPPTVQLEMFIDTRWSDFGPGDAVHFVISAADVDYLIRDAIPGTYSMQADLSGDKLVLWS